MKLKKIGEGVVCVLFFYLMYGFLPMGIAMSASGGAIARWDIWGLALLFPTLIMLFIWHTNRGGKGSDD